MANLVNDLQYTLRQLRKTPSFAVVAIVALGIGVGANITVFGFMNSWLFHPLDVKDSGQLVRVFGDLTKNPGLTDSPAYIPANDYYEYRSRNESFSELAAQHIGGPARVRLDGPPY